MLGRHPFNRLAAVLIIVAGPLFADAPAALQVLMIGNSYTGRIRGSLEVVRTAGTQPLAITYITPGGRQLAQHADDAKVAAAITSCKWDVVVLQDQSQTPAYIPQRFREGADKLIAAIRANRADTRIILYQTWGRRDGDKQNQGASPDYASMQAALTAAYASEAQARNCELARVGEAWNRIYDQDRDLFKKLYSADGSHPGAFGAYLAACIICRQITGIAPDAAVLPKDITKADADRLRQFLPPSPAGTHP